MDAPAARLIVNIDVDGLARGEVFCCAALGLRPDRRFGGSMVELLGAAEPLYLLVKAEDTPASPDHDVRRDYRRHWTPVHLDVEVDDLEAALDRAFAAGAQLEGEVGQHAWGDIAMLSDPFGHGICLLRFRGRGYDEVADA